MSTTLNGVGVSKGIAIGQIYVFSRTLTIAQEIKVSKSEQSKEIKLLKKAITQATNQLLKVKNKISTELPVEVFAFIDTHLLMLEDPAFSDDVISLIKQHSCNAQWALQLQSNHLTSVFEAMEDPYLRSRKDDIAHITNRIQECLTNNITLGADSDALKGRIIVADDLAPTDTLMMQHQKIAGFITEFGGPLSHTAILARNLGIPAIVGVHDARQLIKTDNPIIVDGSKGTILIDPDKATLKTYRSLKRDALSRKNILNELKNKPAITLDNKKIIIHGNIDRPKDINTLQKYEDTGVGLYRTEFLFMEKMVWPDEETQFKVYKRAISKLNDKTLIIRTADLGADKEIPSAQGPLIHNPALGLRAIRRCLKEPELFIHQLCAILRASAFGDVQMMIPMLTSIEEVQQVLDLIEQAKHALRARQIDFDENIPIGAMIEVPAAALSAYAFAKKLDFLSLGTNDLIQYTLALDRIDDEVSYLYNPLNPAVLSLIYQTIQAGKAANVPVSLCGEMASDTRYTRLLLGMGLNSFSVQPNALLEVKKIIINSRLSSLRTKVKKILECFDADEITMLVDRLNKS